MGGEMANTTATEVITNFHSLFQDKKTLPEGLEIMWLKKANSRYSVELEPLIFDEDTNEYDKKLSAYTIDTLAEFMKQLYQERELSRVNKIATIVTNELSMDGMGVNKKQTLEELKYISNKAKKMVDNQKPTAYA
jgi:hypothetical protein